jgi:hypothetical protein
MGKQGTAGKRKQATLMFPQKFEIIRMDESGNN